MPFIDFGALKERVSMEQAAQVLGLQLSPTGGQLRGPCPACKSGGDRAIVITPAKGLFYCFAKKSGGDVIALTSHIEGIGTKEAAEYLDFHFGTVPVEGTVISTSTVSKERATAPQKQEARSQPAPAFDPDKFFAKLQFEHGEVQAAGYAAEDAERIGLGWHPQYKALFVGHRNADGTWSGFSKLKDGKLTPPPRWITSTVVPFQKRA